MSVFSRFMIFASLVLPATALCFFVTYFVIVKALLKNPFKKINLLLSFFMAWFISSTPGFLYGGSVYDGFYLIAWSMVGSLTSLIVFFCASKNNEIEPATMKAHRGFFYTDAKKGEQVAELIMSLAGENEFIKLIRSTPEPMSFRLIIDHMLVCAGAATYALAFSMRGKPDAYGNATQSMINRLVAQLEKMSDSGVNFSVKDVIVNEKEKSMFLQQGWNFNENTDIYSIFGVIGDYRIIKYSKAIGEGLSSAAAESDGAKLTTKLMQETKDSCGADNYPYVELKLLYTNRIMNIVRYCYNS